jgi:hypothetical protein
MRQRRPVSFITGALVASVFLGAACSPRRSSGGNDTTREGYGFALEVGESCLPESDERAKAIAATLRTFTSAYSARDVARLYEVFEPVEIFDPVAVPVMGRISVTDRGEWLRAMSRSGDQFRIVSACIMMPGGTAGGDLEVERSNEVLRSAGLASVTLDYKVQVELPAHLLPSEPAPLPGRPSPQAPREPRIVRLVGYLAAESPAASQFCGKFGARFRELGLEQCG